MVTHQHPSLSLRCSTNLCGDSRDIYSQCFVVFNVADTDRIWNICMNLWDRPAGSGGCPRSASAAPPQCFSSAVHALHLPAVSQFDPMSLGWPLEASSSRADRPLCSWTDITGHLSSFQRRQHLLTFPIDLVQFQLWQGGEIGPAEGALAEPVDPPVFTDAAQTEAVSTGDENRAAEPVQTDTAPEELRHTRSPRLPVCRLLAAETGTPKQTSQL